MPGALRQDGFAVEITDGFDANEVELIRQDGQDGKASLFTDPNSCPRGTGNTRVIVEVHRPG
jgi:hypothetical protein